MAKGDDALAAMIAEPLAPFEGRDVKRSAITIPGAGGGLREALAFEPVSLKKGQRVYVLLETYVDDVKFETIKSKGEDTGADTRVHILKVAKEGATFVDPEFAVSHLAEQRERIQLLREKAAGIQRLDVEGDGQDTTAE